VISESQVVNFKKENTVNWFDSVIVFAVVCTALGLFLVLLLALDMLVH